MSSVTVLEQPRQRIQRVVHRAQSGNYRGWIVGFGVALAILFIAALVIPIRGTSAMVTAFRPDVQSRVEYQKDRFRERRLWEYVSAVRRDYDRLVGGLKEPGYHESLAAECQAERVLAMIERTIAVLERADKTAFAQPVAEQLQPMRMLYAGLVRELRAHRALNKPRTPAEPLELIPTPPAKFQRCDG